MTPEPRDLTERRVEAIARVINPDAFSDKALSIYSFSVGRATQEARDSAASIIAADPATALLERAAEENRKLQESLDKANDLIASVGEWFIRDAKSQGLKALPRVMVKVLAHGTGKHINMTGNL